MTGQLEAAAQGMLVLTEVEIQAGRLTEYHALFEEQLQLLGGDGPLERIVARRRTGAIWQFGRIAPVKPRAGDLPGLRRQELFADSEWRGRHTNLLVDELDQCNQFMIAARVAPTAAVITQRGNVRRFG